MLTSHMNTLEHSVLPLSPVIPIAIYAVIALIVVVETGLIFGFFFPGDLLLLAAGILAGSYRNVSLTSVLLTAAVASFLGSQAGFFIGIKFGRIVIRNENPPSVDHSITRSQELLAKGGWVTVLFANFLPGLRSFVPVVAGQIAMNKFKYLTANAIGSIAWASAFTWLGYKLAEFTSIRESPFVVLAALFLISSGASILNYMRAL
jgi:membrane-associated protein